MIIQGVIYFTGRPMKGWVLVEPKGVATDVMLSKWIDRAWSFASGLPAKKSAR